MLDVMGGIWFTDSIKSFEGKEAAEMLQGAWLVEIAELHAFEKSGVERIKQFISARGDRFRAAYGRRAVTHMRTVLSRWCCSSFVRCCAWWSTSPSPGRMTA